jgi:ABC-type multidrug transport system fused ATPase/permease subunit
MGIALLLASSAAGLLQPWPLKFVLDSVLGSRAPPTWLARLTGAVLTLAPGELDPRFALLGLLCGGIVLIQLLVGSLTVLSTSVLVSTGLRMVFRLRCALFDQMQRQSLRFHDANPVGDSLYRVTWDTYSIQAMFNSGLVPAITAGATLLGISAILLSKDWLLTVAALSVGVPIFWLIQGMDRPMSAHSMRVQERESEVSSRVQEALSSIRVVQAYVREDFESGRFRANADASLKANLRLTILQTLSSAAVSFVLAAGTGLVIWIAARAVIAGRLTAGDVVLMAGYLAMLYNPLETLAYTAANVQSAAAKGRRVFSVLDAPPNIADAPGVSAPARRATGAVRFEDISFAYRPGHAVLRGFSIDVPPGKTVAFIGPSGAGKTTVVGLMARFYDPDAGRILLDGRDLRELPVAWLRRNIALVPQEPALFSTSIFENIAYGRPDASASEVTAAAVAAGVTEFVEKLPNGFDTETGERGVSLSGGQRQRISIARAFLKDAPILIMDEPTSALDTATERQLLAAMERLKLGRTTLIIAHRLSTIRNADLIVAISDGSVAEMGTHAELCRAGGLYASLQAAQRGP